MSQVRFMVIDRMVTGCVCALHGPQILPAASPLGSWSPPFLHAQLVLALHTHSEDLVQFVPKQLAENKEFS